MTAEYGDAVYVTKRYELHAAAKKQSAGVEPKGHGSHRAATLLRSSFGPRRATGRWAALFILGW
jgi:hypothetical protein